MPGSQRKVHGPIGCGCLVQQNLPQGTNALQHGDFSGNAGLYSLELSHQRCRGDVQGFARQGFWPRRTEETLGTAAKQTVVMGRHPLASGANVISTVGVAPVYFFTARLSLVLLEPVDGVAVF